MLTFSPTEMVKIQILNIRIGNVLYQCSEEDGAYTEDQALADYIATCFIHTPFTKHSVIAVNLWLNRGLPSRGLNILPYFSVLFISQSSPFTLFSFLWHKHLESCSLSSVHSYHSPITFIVKAIHLCVKVLLGCMCRNSVVFSESKFLPSLSDQ